MTLRSFYGPPIEIPPMILKGSTSLANIAALLDTNVKKVHVAGQILLQGGSAGGSKTISAAGGGKVHWRTGSVTWNAAGSTVRVGLQDLSTSLSPVQGEGWAGPGSVVYKDLVQGVDTLTLNTPYATAMATGTKTVAHNDRIAVCFELTVKNGSDLVNVNSNQTAYGSQGYNFPAVMLYVAAFARLVCNPATVIEFDDGTLGWFANSCVTLAGQGTQAFNQSTGTADEYGNIFTPLVPMRAVGICANVNVGAATPDFELCLYSDPLNIGVGIALVDKIVVDATQLGSVAGSTGVVDMAFATEQVLAAGTSYGITIRPTTANNVTTSWQDVVDPAHWKVMGLDDTCYAIRRLDNSGGFADYNNGTPKTRRMNICLLVDQFDDGTSGGGGGGGMLQGNLRGNMQ